MSNVTWDTVSLGEVCRIEAGAGFPVVYQGLKNQEFPFFKVGDMNTMGNEIEMRVFQHSISEEVRKKLRAIAFPAGTIVFPKIGAAIATNKKRLLVNPSCVDNNVMALIPSENLDSGFLYYLLLNKDLSDFANTGNPPSIRQTTIEEWAIPLPPLPEQKRIASLLRRADRLRQLRHTAHDLGDALLQSVFLEMFGKVRGKTNEELLGNISDIASGVTKGQNYNGRKTVEVPYLRVANVQDGYLDLSEIKTIQALPSEVEELRLQVGDVVMTEGGDFDKLGRGAIWRGEIENCIHQNHIFRVRLDKARVIPEFFENYLLSPEAKKYFLTASKQTTNLASINMTQLKQLPVPLYPLSLQEEFAGVVRRVESLRGRISEAERQVEGLFESLLNDAFSN